MKYFITDELSFETRILNFVCIVGVIASGVAFISRLIAGLGIISILPLFFMSSAISGVLFMSFKKAKMSGFLTTIIVCGVSVIFWPILFFTIGGPGSGMAVYFALAIILDFMLLKGKTRIFALIMTTTVTIFCYVSTLFFGWKVLPEGGLSTYQLFIDFMQSIFIVGFLIGIMVLFQNKLIQNETKKAELASRSKSDFLANMSHEIRTPINAIIGMASIGADASDVDKKDYAIRKIQDASNHLLGVINDILDMSKIEAGKLELSPENFNFNEMIQRVITVNNFRVEEKKQIL